MATKGTLWSSGYHEELATERSDVQPEPPIQFAMMSTSTAQCRWEDESTIKRSDQPSSYGID